VRGARHAEVSRSSVMAAVRVSSAASRRAADRGFSNVSVSSGRAPSRCAAPNEGTPTVRIVEDDDMSQKQSSHRICRLNPEGFGRQ
jgi:hypothetical protein